jgi:hypothetical protein
MSQPILPIRPAALWSRVMLVVVAGLMALAAGCAHWAARPLSLSQAELQSLLERHFPRQRRVMELFDASLARPTLRLVPERNRLATTLDLTVHERLSGRTLQGSIALEHGLRYEPSDGTLRLSQVTVSGLRLEFGGSALSEPAARLGALLSERVLEDAPIHRLDADKLDALRRAGIEAAEFLVTPRGIELRFVAGRR